MNNKTSKQITNDIQLLELMMNDLYSKSELYKPTYYWKRYEQKIIKELKSLGLDNFRRRKNSMLSTFGATDLLPISTSLLHEPVWKPGKLMNIMELLLDINVFERYFSYISRKISGVNLDDVRLLCFEIAKLYGETRNAKPILNLEISDFGNPEDVFYVDKKMYSTSILNYYIQYAYCSRFINFDKINSMMEIGSGAGKQIEVIKKLHPDMTFYVFEIPPMLYVCEKYLSALFPKSVISYRKTQKMQNIPNNNDGKIYIFGNWKLPEIKNFYYDLFWNSASFQEIEPEVVINYLNYVNHQTKYVFLHEIMEGKERIKKIGERGVLKKTTIKLYKKYLNNFKLMDLSSSTMLPRLSTPYKFSFWFKK